MNILGYLQKIGRALMVPVAVLPAAAILMGIGYWIDPNGWGGGSPVAAFLIKAGAAIIDSMPVLFAVGVAYGMSKPPYAMVAGTPAKVIRMRFAEEEIARLQVLAWWEWPDAQVQALLPLIQQGEVTLLEQAAAHWQQARQPS